MKNKKIEVFCGTGGVGKTTISTSRAIHLAGLGKKVLLITIDPAKRLKQVLGIPDDNSGEPYRIENKDIISETGSLDTLLLAPGATLKRIIGESQNNIIETLSTPYGGMNEITAVLEVQYQLSTNNYDVIILDTPPGKHFIDFLESARKIHSFFDKTFLEVFKFVGSVNKPKRILTKLLTTGVDKLLSYLEKVTGQGFVHEFTEAIHILYGKRDKFIQGLDLEKDLMNDSLTNWFLVTSADQLKGSDANELLKASSKFIQGDNYLLVNKSWKTFLKDWDPQENEKLQSLKEKLIESESELEKASSKYTLTKIEFPEVFEDSPIEQVKGLVNKWKTI